MWGYCGNLNAIIWKGNWTNWNRARGSWEKWCSKGNLWQRKTLRCVLPETVRAQHRKDSTLILSLFPSVLGTCKCNERALYAAAIQTLNINSTQITSPLTIKNSIEIVNNIFLLYRFWSEASLQKLLQEASCKGKHCDTLVTALSKASEIHWPWQ